MAIEGFTEACASPPMVASRAFDTVEPVSAPPLSATAQRAAKDDSRRMKAFLEFAIRHNYRLTYDLFVPDPGT